MKINCETHHLPNDHRFDDCVLEKTYLEDGRKIIVRAYKISNGVDIEVFVDKVFHGVCCTCVDQNAESEDVLRRVSIFSKEWFGLQNVLEPDARRTSFEVYVE